MRAAPVNGSGANAVSAAGWSLDGLTISRGPDVEPAVILAA